MQREYTGFNSINKLSRILDEYNAKKILLITGKNSYKACGLSLKIEDILIGKGVRRIKNFSVNPEISEIVGIGNSILQSDFDLVIAAGGGSVIDFAKSLNIKISNNFDFQSIVLNNDLIKNKGLPLIAIPTTAGTGSEVTHFSVVYIENKKHSMAHPFIKPDIAIIDPQFTYKIPPYVTACSGLDALCQAIESHWSVNSTDESKTFSYRAIVKIKNNLINAIKTSSKISRDELSIASNLAGKAIDITKTTAPHAISYPITKIFNVPHGHAVAMTLGHFFLINELFIDENLVQDQRGPKYVRNLMIELRKILQWETPKIAFQKWYEFLDQCGITSDLNKLGVTSNDIKKISNGINTERLSNNPISITKDDVKRILKFHLSIK